MKRNKPFKVALIGTGGVAHAHVSAFRKAGVEVAAVAGINAPKATPLHDNMESPCRSVTTRAVPNGRNRCHCDLPAEFPPQRWLLLPCALASMSSQKTHGN